MTAYDVQAFAIFALLIYGLARLGIAYLNRTGDE